MRKCEQTDVNELDTVINMTRMVFGH